MKKWLLLISVVFYFALAIAEDEESGSYEGLDYSLLSANSSLMEQSSSMNNMASGTVSFSLPLVSAPGVSFGATYSNANVHDVVQTINKNKPTGLMGLGWNFSFDKIIRDHKNTVSIHDDDFYLESNGQITNLICTNIDSETYTFEIPTDASKIVVFHKNLNKWVISDFSGNYITYGDDNSAIRWIIVWGNWIGDSMQTDGNIESNF
ncbi:MAG: hypothetical protein PHR06_05170, partial [Candidatus Cloacimonetes bacterium]|nr:hypothetical protein [Candidatus Cloacimonadota bacterium]